MDFWNKVIRKPGVWIASTAALAGAFAMAAIYNGAGVPAAKANPEVQTTNISGFTTKSIDSLRAMDEAFTSLVDYVAPSVVHIRAESPGSTNANGQRTGRVMGEGSGVIFRSDGWIVTNDHVVAGFDKVTVVLNDGRELQGTVRRAKDLQNDIAVVKVDETNLPAAKFADSSKVKAGQFAIAIGAPFGLENTVTVGHISGLGRSSGVMDPRVGSRGYSDMIQTDAPINPGNSGGPLLNIDGEVVGINTSILGSGGSMFGGQGGNVGIGFAIPSNQARVVAEMLIEKGKVTRGYLGLAPDNLKPYEAKDLGVVDGAIVREVPNDGPAAIAGIKKGDVITKIGTYQVRNQQDLRNTMFHYAPGTSVTVELMRDKVKKSVDLKVGELPKQMIAQDMSNGSSQLPNDGFDFEMPERFKEFFGTPDKESEKAPNAGEERTGQPKLGVQVSAITDELRKQYSIPADVKGVVVLSVNKGSIAEAQNLKAGDVIQTLGGKDITTPEQLVDAMKEVKWGDSRSIKYSRFAKGMNMTSQTDILFR